MGSKTSKEKKIKILMILKATFVEWLKNFNNYSKLVLVVAIPVAILTIVQADGNIGDYGLLMAFAWSFSAMALIVYGVRQKKLKKVKVSAIYSEGSGRFFQYIGASLVLILIAIPSIAGVVTIFMAYTQPATTSLLFISLGAVGILVSILLMVRFSLSQVIAVSENRSVYQSLLKSQSITKNVRWKVFLGFLIIFSLIVVIANGVQMLLSIKQVINENIYINNMIYIIESTIFLPIIYIYQIKLLEELNG